MKLVAWNVGHQTQDRAIKPRFAEVIAKLAPDILTLNEYVHGPMRGPVLESLAAVGLVHVEVSARIGTHNQVLIASRHPLASGDLPGPRTEGGAGESNFLHVKLADTGLEVVGIRVPAYEKKAVLQDYWRKLAAILRSTASRRILYVGDFNADPDVPSYTGAATLAALREEGWHLPTPSGAWSFVSGSRIDHVLAAPGVDALKATYVAELDGIDLASRDTASRISDHAALVVEFDVSPASR